MTVLSRCLRRYAPLLTPVSIFTLFFTLFALTAGVSLSRHSLAPHFVYLAESLLQGRLDLIHVPVPPYDLTPFEGRWYVSFPPLPALLMTPLVAVLGLSVSDIAFTVTLGALNVSLFYLVLTNLKVGGPGFRVWLCVLLGLGTPHWYCAALGSVWYTAHVAAITCLCLYMVEATGQNRPILSGLWLGLGFLARAPVVLAFPLSLVSGIHKARRLGNGIRFLLLFTLGAAPALLGQATYNWMRFGDPLEFGYRWMNSPGALAERQALWGQFSPHFLPENLYTMLVRPPMITLWPLHIEPDPWGMGLLFTCPALLLALPTLAELWHSRTARRTSSPGSSADPIKTATHSLRLGLWLSIALVQLPSLLYFNTGSYQFGYRFALDWLPMAVPLVALGATDRWRRQWAQALITVSVLMHLWGVLWMYPNFNGQPWHLQYVQLLRRFLH